MQSKSLRLALIAMSWCITHASAQTVLNVATGSNTGTYSSMFKDMGKVCINSSFLKERGTNGSLDNIELLLDNSVSLAFVQSDVVKAKQQLDGDVRVNELKTLLPLYQEEIHVIAKSGSHKNGLFGKSTTYVTLTDLANKRVAAWGGSVITTKVLSAFYNLHLDIKVYSDQKSALAALTKDDVDGLIAVIGQPAPWVKALSSSYVALSITPNDKTKALYKETKLSYLNLSLSATPTLSVQSLLVTRDFKSQSKKDQLLKYASCVKSHLVDLQETEGFHPKWNEVTFSDYSAWPQYK